MHLDVQCATHMLASMWKGITAKLLHAPQINTNDARKPSPTLACTKTLRREKAGCTRIPNCDCSTCSLTDIQTVSAVPCTKGPRRLSAGSWTLSLRQLQDSATRVLSSRTCKSDLYRGGGRSSLIRQGSPSQLQVCHTAAS